VAVNGVVVAVQSSAQHWPSPYACNGARLAWNLRDPTPAMLAAAAQVVAGLLPVSVGVDAATLRPTRDYTWAVGEHPTAVTAPGSAHWSALHVDNAHRHAFAVRIDALAAATATAVRR
jgi:hypothetical protein